MTFVFNDSDCELILNFLLKSDFHIESKCLHRMFQSFTHLFQLPGDGGTTSWKPVFLALTDKDMVLYDTAPWSKEEWATPFQDHQLLATRFETF